MKLDSLSNKLKTSSNKKEIFKLQRLILGHLSNEHNTDSVINELANLLVSAQGSRYMDEEGEIRLLMGNLQLESSEYELALTNFNKALENFEAMNMLEGVAHAYSRIGAACMYIGDYKRSIKVNELAIEHFKKDNNSRALATCYGNLGLAYKRLGNLMAAINYQNRSLKEETKIGNKQGMASCLNAIGNIYFTHGNYPEALKNYFNALRLQEDTKYEPGIAHALSNIGLVFKKQKEYSKALEYSLRSLRCEEHIGDEQGVAISWSNIGDIYFKMQQPDSAWISYKKGLKIFQKLKDETGLADIYSSVGLLWEKRRSYDSAIFYHFKALEIYERQNSKENQGVEYFNLANCFANKGNLERSISTALNSLKISEEIGSLENMELVEELLSSLYERKGNTNLALFHFKKFTLYKDSLFNIEKSKDLTRNELKFEFEKEAEKDSLENLHQQKIKDEQIRVNNLEIKQQRTKGYALLTGVILLFIFGAFMYNRFKVTKAQKQIIESQKKVVEEQQREIHDSIAYAKRIQSSFMASEDQLKHRVDDYFVLFKPKDVVSGDFYWTESSGSEVYLCVADSTGHGIPGAFMSLLNISLMNEAVLSKNFTTTNQILDFVRKVLILGLKPDESGQGGNDGMDCVLIKLDQSKMVLHYSGANNPLWLIRENQVIELEADKMPVGRSPRKKVPFSSKEYAIKKGDQLYLFTDGYPDQFGGPKGKKFKYKQLNDLLLRISAKSMQEQRNILEQEFANWKGDLEQVDDVCVVGIRI